jgi:hypothetical protein
MAQAEAWRSALYGVICERSLKRNYAKRLGRLLGITGENEIQRTRRDKAHKRRLRDAARMDTDAYRDRRKIRKIITANQVAKEASKEEKHKSGKVPLSSIGAKTTAKKMTKQRALPTCGNCGVKGHTRNACMQPGGGVAAKSASKEQPSFLDAL